MKVFSRFRKSTSTTVSKSVNQNDTTSTIPKSKTVIFSSSTSTSTSTSSTKENSKNNNNNNNKENKSSPLRTPSPSSPSSVKKEKDNSDKSDKSDVIQATLSSFLQRRQKTSGNDNGSGMKRTSLDIPKRESKRMSIDVSKSKRSSIERSKRTSIDMTKRRPERKDLELVKRRVVLPVAIFDRPMLTEVEFMIDARYRHVKIIGSGSFGVVASALDSRTGSKVAIKKVIGAFSSSRSSRYALREVRLLRHMQHGNIVPLCDIDVPDDFKAWNDLYIVTPLLHCDLRQVIVSGRLKNNIREQKRIAWGILNGLRYMHCQGLMHRDIKSKNVLLNDDLSIVQLCDLGHSRFHTSVDIEENEIEIENEIEDEPGLTGAVGTMIQSAPEISLGCEYNIGVDIWSAACVISELVHQTPGQTLFDNTSKSKHISEIFQVIGYPTDPELSTMPDYVRWYLKRCKRSASKYAGVNTIAERLGLNDNDVVIDLLKKMLVFDAAGRVSAQEAMNHQWFDDVREECELKDSLMKKSQYKFTESEPPKKASKADMKQLMWEEVVGMHPELAPQRKVT